MKKEEWRNIGIIDGIDFTGLYQVSNYGLVKSLNYLRTGREQVLKYGMDGNGYLQVCLSKNGKRKWSRINRLVAIAFDLPIPEELKHLPLECLEADHIDTDKTNNCLWNLRWTDSKGNKENPLTRQHMSEAHKGVFNTKKSKPVLQINKDTDEVIMEWPSLAEVYRQLGYSQANICNCCNGKLNTAYRFKWKYAV